MDNDGIVAPHPPIARAMRVVKEALAANEHNVAGSTFQNQS
jgi:hypothetical protein